MLRQNNYYANKFLAASILTNFGSYLIVQKANRNKKSNEYKQYDGT